MVNSNTKRKVFAVLAGGLVLGVGVGVTLAAWNDSEFATGTFTAGSFNLEGSLDGTAYEEHEDAAGAAELEFSTNFDNLSPTDTVYAPFWVRLDETTTNDATVTVSLASGVGLNATEIAYAVYGIGAGAACDDSVTGTPLLEGVALAAPATGGTFDLTQGSGAAGDPQKLCFVATAGAGLTEGDDATAVWQFAAESTN